MRAKVFVIDIDANFSGGELHAEFGTRRRSLWPRFPPHLARIDARTRAVDRGIRDTHIQSRLKDHPFVKTQKGEVCHIFLGHSDSCYMHALTNNF